MRQTYTGAIECLIVDDCGTDESIPIAERMIAEYDGPIRFEILHHKLNRGLSAARNTGTDAATGEYIYYLDSDDAIMPDCIEKLMRPVMRDPSIEMVLGDYANIPDDNTVCENRETFKRRISHRGKRWRSLVLKCMCWLGTG